MARQTKAEKLTEARIGKAFRARCCNIQIDVFDLAKVSAVGRQAVADGADDDALADRIAAYVETIRKN